MRYRTVLLILLISLFFSSTVIYSDESGVVHPAQSGDNPLPEPKTGNAPEEQIKTPTASLTGTVPHYSPEMEASHLNFRLSQDGTVATMFCDRASTDAMKDLISQLEQSGNLGKVKAIVYTPEGYTPKLILLGEKEELPRKIELFKQFMYDQSQAHMVVIAASLRELSEQDAYNIGLTLSPDIMGVTVSALGSYNAQKGQLPGYSADISASLDAVPLSRIIQFNEALNRAKVLVSSEVYTRNGTKTLLTNMQQVPVFSTDSNKNVMTSYQQLETSVDVVPTTVEYKIDNPGESQVRVDVTVKISVVTGERSLGDATAPEYTTKTFATTRVLKANNERYVVGTFVNDARLKKQQGIPLLSKIPILKYFFSRYGDEMQRNVAILTLAVRLIPMTVKDLTIDVEHHNPLEMLYERKGSMKDAE